MRKVGAQGEVGRSYELWIVSDKLQRPRSLGVIGRNDFTARPVLSGYDADLVNQATRVLVARQVPLEVAEPVGKAGSTPCQLSPSI